LDGTGNQTEFGAEINIHFPDGKALDKPGVLAAPDSTVQSPAEPNPAYPHKFGRDKRDTELQRRQHAITKWYESRAPDDFVAVAGRIHVRLH
jgi:hypothetical protein